MQYENTEYSPHGLEMLEKQELCKDYMQGLEPCWKLCDAPFLALWERESRHFNDESTSNQGIGTELIKTAHSLAGGKNDIAVYLVANENAIAFYEKLGMKKANDVMEYDHIEWTPFTVK